MIGYKRVSDEISVVVKIAGKPRNRTLTQVCAPTSAVEEEDKRKTWRQEEVL